MEINIIIFFVNRTVNFVIIKKNNVTTLYMHTGWSKNGVLTVHYGVEEITVNVRKMFKKFNWTYLLCVWRSLKVALNRSIILKYVGTYMYEIVILHNYHL
jgi:hypothetical protein